MTEFRECPECASKPGAPVLCPACLERRAAFAGYGDPVAHEEPTDSERLFTALEAILDELVSIRHAIEDTAAAASQR